MAGGIELATSLTGLGTDIFGTSGKSSGTKTTTQTGTQTASQRGRETSREQFVVDKAAIDKTIQDILAGSEGLAEIFTEEDIVGLYSTTEGKSGIEDLLAKVAGEVAKLTGVRETEATQSLEEAQAFEQIGTEKTKTKSSSGGLLGGIF